MMISLNVPRWIVSHGYERGFFMRLPAFIIALILLKSGPAVSAVPAWANSPIADEVFYHFMPIAWRDSDNDGGASGKRFGDFNGMTASLDYLQYLGVTSVWMNPIFPSPAYHGYQHGPADTVNPWFGTEAEFLNFVAQAKARGIKVYVDLVCYGISHNSVYFQSAYNNPSSPYDAWLSFTNSANTTYNGYTFTTWNGSNVGFINWDLRNPGAKQTVIDWSKKWLDPNGDGDPSDGIAGYRLDHVWVRYPTEPEGLGYNLDTFWTPWKDALKTVNPNVVTFVEQALWHLYGDEFLGVHDAAFMKPYETAARNSVLHENAEQMYPEMVRTLDAYNRAGQGTFMCIMGDHDVKRLASAIEADHSGLADRNKAAAAMLMLQAFPPIIYFGDELGMTGEKGDWGTDANDIPMREPFKWKAVNNGSPMTNYYVLNSQSYNARYSRDNDGKSVEEQQGVSGSLLETYRKLIALRKANAALRRGDFTSATVGDTHIWAFTRQYAPDAGTGQTLLVAINVGGWDITTNINISHLVVPSAGAEVRDVTNGVLQTTLTNANKGGYSVTVPRYGYRVLSIGVSSGTPPELNVVDGLDIINSLSPAGVDVLQDTPTNQGDNSCELNRLLLKPRADGLLIGITGNLATDGRALALFVQSGSNGQSTINTSTMVAPPSGLKELTGLKFDAGFAPDHLFFLNTYGGTMYVDYLSLPSSGPGVKTYLGNNAVNSHSPTLTGGDNPYGIQASFDNTNTAGITGSSISGAPTATKGLEVLIPWPALGLSNGCGATFRVAAGIVLNDGTVTNQWLPGIGGSMNNIGIAPNLASVPGTQHATLNLAYTVTDATSALRMAAGLTQAGTDKYPCYNLDGVKGIGVGDAVLILNRALLNP